MFRRARLASLVRHLPPVQQTGAVVDDDDDDDDGEKRALVSASDEAWIELYK